jgi:hypothetical protein
VVIRLGITGYPSKAIPAITAAVDEGLSIRHEILYILGPMIQFWLPTRLEMIMISKACTASLLRREEPKGLLVS